MTIRVVVADDSDTVRKMLVSLLRQDGRFEVVGQAVDGQQAVAMAKLLRPDVMTMDVRMPKLDGLAATKKIMATNPTRILVVCSLSEQREINLSFEATGAGALEVLPKPHASTLGGVSAWGRRVTEAVLAVADSSLMRSRPSYPPPPLPSPGAKVNAVAIAASTGGPPALAQVLSALPGAFPAPVLIAQHVAAGFASGLQRWVSQCTALSVVTARSDLPLQPGCVYLAPDGCDLEVHPHRRCAIVTRSQSACVPSANRLFASLATAYGVGALGVILTGMGDDGAEGLLAIRRAGGVTLGQDETSSVVYGMPRAAFIAGAVAAQMSIADLGAAVARLGVRAVLP